MELGMDTLDMDSFVCEFDRILNLTLPSDAAEYVVTITEQLGIIVGMVVVLALGLPGNLAFLFVVYKLPHMRTITNFFLANLAVADIIFLVVTVFMYIIYLGLSPVRSDYNVASLFSCVGVFLVSHITYFTSICCVTVVSLERFYAVCKPIQHRVMNTKTRAKRVMLASWVAPVILTALAMPKYGRLEMSCIMWPDGEKYEDLPQILGFCRPVVPWWLIVGEFTTVSPFLIALPCNVFMYIRIVKSLSSRSVLKTAGQQRLPPQAVQVRNQVARMLIINGIVFFLCQATNQFITVPYMLSFITGVPISDTYDRLATVIDVGRIAVFVNSAVNPLIYNASSPHYRTAFKQAFGCSSKKTKTAMAIPAAVKPEEAARGSIQPTASNSSPRIQDNYPPTLVQQTEDEHRIITTDEDVNLACLEDGINTGVDNRGLEAEVQAHISPSRDEPDEDDEQEKQDVSNIRGDLESIAEET